MNAVDLQAAVVAALAPVADQLPPSPPGDRVDPADRLDVRSTDVARALGCPAATALDGDEPFEERAATAGWGAASTVLDRLVTGHVDPRRGQGPTDPASGFRVAMKEIDLLDWPWTWLGGAGPADRAVTAAEVHRRVAATARVLDPWPPPDARHVGLRPMWTFPGRPLRLRGRVDLVLGRRDGSHTIVVTMGGDHGAATHARLAFEAVVEALMLRRAPATVLGLLPDAGRRWPLTVDDDLLAEGIGVASLGAGVMLGRRRRDAARARPSARATVPDLRALPPAAPSG